MTTSTAFRFDQPATTGLLLLNLGTPDSPSVPDVRRYLAEFLSDPRIVEIPPLAWKLVLHGVILRTRPRKSAKAYQAVWNEKGSPLLYLSERLLAELPDDIPVALGMRYGNPSIETALDKLRGLNAQRILVLPMYPQYSATTTASTFDAIARVLSKWRWIPELRLVNQYHAHPLYIDALADSVRAWQAEHGTPERLLMSFHGIPKDYATAGDPYPGQCRRTARLLADKLGLRDGAWALSFQSRMGPREWLKPYTSETLKQWGKEGVERVQVICPGFSVDCLETLEEIAVENRDYFLGAGGKTYEYIPALNAGDGQRALLHSLWRQHTEGWEDTPPGSAETV